MRILVTGGAGFIGSHLVDALVGLGHAVSVVDNLSTGRREQVNPAATLLEVDITDGQLMTAVAAERPDAVFHLAAQGDVRQSVADPVGDARINILGALNVLAAALAVGTRTFIFASSGGAIYGDTNQRPTPEDHPARPASPYGIGKMTFEHYLRLLGGNVMRTVALRCANVYGPRQNALGEAGVVAIFSGRMLRDQPAVINGDGTQTRDFVYVDDVVAANLAALSYAQSGAFNIGTGVETSINQVAALIQQAAGGGTLTHGPAKPGEQQTSCLDCHRAATVLGWQPTVTLEEGITKTVAWFAKNTTSDVVR